MYFNSKIQPYFQYSYFQCLFSSLQSIKTLHLIEITWGKNIDYFVSDIKIKKDESIF